MSAAITLTLPGESVTAEVTWEQVRAYLRAVGWRPSPKAAPESRVVMWERHDANSVVYCGGVEPWENSRNIVATVNTLARLTSVSPGAMLLRITAPQWQPDLWTLVRARLGSTANGARLNLVLTLDRPPLVTWQRAYDEGPSDYREEEAPDVDACLRAVIAYEDAADARERCHQEPDARPYDDRCRAITSLGRCRYAWDHAKRGVECKGSGCALPCGCVRPAFCALCAASEVLP